MMLFQGSTFCVMVLKLYVVLYAFAFMRLYLYKLITGLDNYINERHSYRNVN